LELTDGTLQFNVLFGVFFNEVVQLLPEGGLLHQGSNGDKGRNEQQEPKDNHREDE
jgi:hypothetical protein